MRTWPLQYHAHRRGWFRSFLESYTQSQNCYVSEARYDDTERILVTIWLAKALVVLQDDAEEPDDDPESLIPILQTVLQVDGNN